MRTPFRRTDPLLLLALAAVAVQPALSVSEAAWVPHLDLLPALALGGVLLGFLLARTRLPGVLAHLLVVGLGAEALAYAFSAYGGQPTLAERVDWLLGRLATWVEIVRSGGASNDPLLFALTMGAAAWLLGYTTAWLLVREDVAWLAVTANGLALLVNLSYAPPEMGGALGRFLLAASVLLALHHALQRQQLWQTSRLRVDRFLGARVIAGALALTVLLLAASALLPSGGTNVAVASAWQRGSAPWRSLEGSFDRVFASLNANRELPSRGVNFGRTLAPRGSFDLSDTPIFEATSPEPFYWRATTADRYTSQAISSSDTTTLPLEANQPLLPADQAPEGRVATQIDITLLASRSAAAFAPDQPLRLSLPVEADLRPGSNGANAPGEVAALRLATPLTEGQHYTVTSLVSVAGIQQLRATDQSYPAWLQERYLQLPRTLPPRVADLARQVVGNAPTAYDKAVAIEQFLRTQFTYSTHVPEVPPDRDWVDYLLFDSHEGYCDYFATAMTVMLRTQGVAARVASGFAPGEAGSTPGTWLVRESHAHSWVEVYFPRFGWITFEPSAIRPVPERPETAAPTPVPTPAASESAVPPASDESNQPSSPFSLPNAPALQLPTWVLPTLGILGLLAIVCALAAAAFTLAWRRGLGPLAPYQRPYVELLRLARWLGVLRSGPAHTPYETADALARTAPAAEHTIRDLAHAYVEGTYANRPPRADPVTQWLAARRRLARAFLSHRARAIFKRGVDRSP